MTGTEYPVVFVHGFKGAFLDHIGSGNRHWLTGRQALGGRSPGIALPTVWDGEVQARDELIATEPLHQVLHARFYGPFIRWCQQRFAAFYSFVYDWRRDNRESAKGFVHFLDQISRRHEGRPVRVIAHSNGGLITYLALLEVPEQIHSIVFAGTPFRGGIGVLDDLHLGVRTGFNTLIAAPEVMATFVTSFSFFPMAHESSQVYSRAGKAIDLDWYELDTWEQLRIGPCARQENLNPVQRQHLSRALACARTLREQLRQRVRQPPPAAVIASGSRPTFCAIRQDPNRPLGWDLTSCAREPGDGRVRLSSCVPPEGMPFDLFETRHEHSQLLSDTAVLDRALQALSGA